MARMMLPRWRRKKPDTPGTWALYRPTVTDVANRFMVLKVTQERLDGGTVDGWSADWWMRIPDFPEEA